MIQPAAAPKTAFQALRMAELLEVIDPTSFSGAFCKP
jgi:hypothetical protein